MDDLLSALVTEALIATDGEIKGEKLIRVGDQFHWVPENLDVSKIEQPELPKPPEGEPTTEELFEQVEAVLSDEAETARARLGVEWGWQPSTHEECDRLVTRYRCAEAERQMYKDQYKRNMAAVNAEIAHIENRYEDALTRDAGSNLEKGKQFARYSAGIIQFTNNKGGWKVGDASDLQEWARRMSPERRAELGITPKQVVYDVPLQAVYNYAELNRLAGCAEVVPGIVHELPHKTWQIKGQPATRKATNDRDQDDATSEDDSRRDADVACAAGSVGAGDQRDDTAED